MTTSKVRAGAGDNFYVSLPNLPQAVLALCLVGAAVAAPQLRLGGLRSVSSVSSVTNQDEVTQFMIEC